MSIAQNESRLRDALRDFYNATGISLQLIKPDFSSFGECVGLHNRYCQLVQKSACGKETCIASDRRLLSRCRETRTMQIHVCHAGLIDIAIPILYENEILAYIILGQLKREVDFSEVKALLEPLSTDLSEMEHCYKTLTVYDENRIQSVANVAAMLAKYILLEHLLISARPAAVQAAVAFIEKHLNQPLSVQTIAKGAGISKSVLYSGFHKCFGCTVSEYVNARRVEFARELLRTTRLSIEEIADRVGFSHTAYFSKIFKQQMEISPLKYRNSTV